MRCRAAPAATQVRPIEPVLFGISGLRRTMWAMGSVVDSGLGAERSPGGVCDAGGFGGWFEGGFVWLFVWLFVIGALLHR